MEKSWLEKETGSGNFDLSKLESICYFTFVWNIFEKACFDKNASIRDMKAKVTNGYFYLEEGTLNYTFEHFQCRYYSEEDNEIVFHSNGDKEITKNLFTKEHSTEKEKIEGVLRIIFRLRNNLYHGLKAIDKLETQNETFMMANKFLTKIIDNINTA